MARIKPVNPGRTPKPAATPADPAPPTATAAGGDPADRNHTRQTRWNGANHNESRQTRWESMNHNESRACR